MQLFVLLYFVIGALVFAFRLKEVQYYKASGKVSDSITERFKEEEEKRLEAILSTENKCSPVVLSLLLGIAAMLFCFAWPIPAVKIIIKRIIK